MLSSRYSLPVAFLLLLALIPTAIHHYIAPTSDDGKSVHAIASELAGFSSKPLLRHKDPWVKSMFDSEDWIERIYKDANAKEIKLFVARSYDYKRLYHHPELALSHGIDLKEKQLVMLSGETEIPVHLLKSGREYGLAAYVLLYEDQFIKEPVLHQFTEALKQMISPRKVMTLFYVSDMKSSSNDNFSQSSSALILTSAIQSFMSGKTVLDTEN